jgi:hypothetical protein
MSTYRQYLNTLRRVPDDIVLAVATRNVEPLFSDRCLCGWFVREQVEQMTGSSADEMDLPYSATIPRCIESFGGTEAEWYRLFRDIYPEPTGASVERAFVERVLEAVS